MNADEQAQDPFSGFWGSRTQGGGPNFEEEIFGDFESFFGMGGAGARERAAKGQDIFLNLEISFMESVTGVKREVKLEKKGVCKTCNGTKCKPGTAPSKCFSCGGRGFINYRQGPMTIQMTCTNCKGAGMSIKHPCPTCRGAGSQIAEYTEQINVPKGINNGQSLRMSGKVR